MLVDTGSNDSLGRLDFAECLSHRRWTLSCRLCETVASNGYSFNVMVGEHRRDYNMVGKRSYGINGRMNDSILGESE